MIFILFKITNNFKINFYDMKIIVKYRLEIIKENAKHDKL